MALSSATRQDFIDYYFDGDMQVPQRYEAMFRQRNEQAGSLTLGGLSTEGTNQVPVWTNSETDIPQARVSDIGNKTVNFTQYGLQFRIRKLDSRFRPGLVQETMTALGRCVANTKALICAAVLNGAFTTTTVVPGSTALAANDHPTADGGTRVNLLSSACDLAAIFAAMALARGWKDYDGGDMDIAEGGWWLAHPVVAGLEQTVQQALGSMVTSDQNQINPVGLFGISQIVWSKITSSTRWFLQSKTWRNLFFWEVLAAEDSITIDEDSRQVKITVDGAWGAGCEAQPTGFIGCGT